VAIEITPEPSEDERRAILTALESARPAFPAYASRWRASALDDLRDGALAEDGRSDPRVVEP
jgi:hypothetical protein